MKTCFEAIWLGHIALCCCCCCCTILIRYTLEIILHLLRYNSTFDKSKNRDNPWPASLEKLLFIHLARPSQSLQFSWKNTCTWNGKQGKIADTKTEAKSIHHTKQPLLGKKVTDSPSPAPIKLLALLGTRCNHPSLLPAHRQSRKLQPSGDLYSSWFRCFGVHPNVCLKYEISPLLGDTRTASVENAVDISLFHFDFRAGYPRLDTTLLSPPENRACLSGIHFRCFRVMPGRTSWPSACYSRESLLIWSFPDFPDSAKGNDDKHGEISGGGRTDDRRARGEKSCCSVSGGCYSKSYVLNPSTSVFMSKVNTSEMGGRRAFCLFVCFFRI